MASSAAVVPTTTDQLLDLVRRSNLLPADVLANKLADYDLPADAGGAAAALVRGGLLTPFQSRLLLAGKYRGFRLGTYVVQDQLGRGGMGTVYLAEHATLRRKVALKVLSADGTAQKAGVERFLREARAAAALDHPNIVRVFDVLQAGELHYIVMEYVPGRTLDSLVQGGGAMAPGRAVGYITQAAAGLQHAYEKGFVHRDIKPANLMVGKDGTVKILDMGLARSVVDSGDRVTEVLDQGAVVGTADYISPEQATDSPGVDTRADIYSLGATLFALVTGQPPFTGSTSQVLVQHQVKPAPSLADFDRTIAPGLAAVVAKMLAKKPADRYATPAEVIAALAPWLPNRDGAQRVMAGLSSRELGRNSGSLQNTLDQVIGGSTGRLNPGPGGGAGRPWLWAAGATVAAAGLGVAGYFLIATKPAGVATVPPAATTTAPTAPAAVTPPARPAAPGGPVFRFDAADLPDFRGTMRGWDTVTDGTVPRLPRGVAVSSWKAEAVGEFARTTVAGRAALGYAARGADATAEIVLDLTAAGAVFQPGREYLATVDYLTDGDAVGVLRAQDLKDNYKTLAEQPLEPTAGAWRTVELRFKPGEKATRLAFQSERAVEAGLLFVGRVVVTDPAAGPAAVFRLDLSGVGPFREQTRDAKPARAIAPGVVPTAWKADGVGEFACEVVDGGPALSLTNVGGPTPSAQLGVELEAPGGAAAVLVPGTDYELRFQYKTAGGGDARAYTQHADFSAIPASVDLPDTGGAWRPAVLPFRREAKPLRLLIDNQQVGPDKTLFLRDLVVAPAGTPTAARPPVLGRTLFALDLSGLAAFRGQFADGRPSVGLPTAAPGLGWFCWKKESVAEFRADSTPAGPAVGVTNLNDAVSSQLTLAVDEAPAGGPLAAGKRYLLRVEYRAENDAAGQVVVRRPGPKQHARADLPATGGAWRWAEVRFDRPADQPLDAVVENAAVGEGNTLWLRAAELWEE